MKFSLYIRFVLFATIDTNCCGLPNNELVLILSNSIRIQDGEHRELQGTIKTTCCTPYIRECGDFGGANLDHYG
jgi:hypothetical protein